jgi:hypothetical protein
MNRRLFLRSHTAAIALPMLESFSFRAFSAEKKLVIPPKRMVFLAMGYGVTKETWFPNIHEKGRDYSLTEGLKPLAHHKNDFTIIQNTSNKYSAEAHWGSTFWLTGANRYGAPGSSFHNTISADQVAANLWGDKTRFTSLQLNGSDKNIAGPGHGPGLSLSWDKGGKPVAGLNDPTLLYHQLFSSPSTPIAQQKKLLAQEKSILDTILVDANDLKKGLTKTDLDKLDEYFSGIRDIETRLNKDEMWMNSPRPNAPIPVPKNHSKGIDEIKLMYDLMVAAIQTDSTRVLTYRLPIAELLNSLGTSIQPHDMSHYVPGDRMKLSQKRDRVQSELLSKLFDKLKQIKEVDGTSLFDHTSIAYGSNLCSVHHLDNCTTLLAGGGASIKLGEHIVLPKDTPLCNVWLTLLQGVGVKINQHGDSTGVVKELIAS